MPIAGVDKEGAHHENDPLYGAATMLNRHYDVIVSGLRPGALLAGALLAKGGLKVLAIDAPELMSPTREGLTFPSHGYMPLGFENPLLLAHALDELRIHPSDRRRIKPQVPPFQVCMPGFRVGIFQDDPPFEAELQREFRAPCPDAPELFEALRQGANTLAQAWGQRRREDPGPGLLQRLGRRIGKERPLFSGESPSFGEFLKGFDLSEELQRFLLLQLSALSHQPDPEALPFPIAAHLLISARGGVPTSPGLTHPILSLLGARLKELRGEIHPALKLEAINTGLGRVKSVDIEGLEGSVECDFLLWGGHGWGLAGVLPEGLRERYQGGGRGLRGELARVSIHMAFKEEVMPMGMGTQVISLQDVEGPLGEGNTVWITTTTDSGKAGVVTLTASTWVKRGGRKADPEALEALCGRMSAHVAKLMPFAERGLVAGYRPDPDILESDPCRLYSAEEVLRLHPQDMGPGPRLPHWNIFSTGPGAYPLLGFEGEIAAGIQAVDCILAAMS